MYSDFAAVEANCSRKIFTFLSTALPSDLPHASAHNRVIALLDLGVDDDGVHSGVHVLRVTQLQGKKELILIHLLIFISSSFSKI